MALFDKKNSDTKQNEMEAMIKAEEEKKEQLLKEIGKKYYSQHAKDAEREFSQLSKAIEDCDNKILEMSNKAIEKSLNEKCRYCGAEVEPKYNFCIFCGKKIER